MSCLKGCQNDTPWHVLVYIYRVTVQVYYINMHSIHVGSYPKISKSKHFFAEIPWKPQPEVLLTRCFFHAHVMWKRMLSCAQCQQLGCSEFVTSVGSGSWDALELCPVTSIQKLKPFSSHTIDWTLTFFDLGPWPYVMRVSYPGTEIEAWLRGWARHDSTTFSFRETNTSFLS